MNNKVQDCRWDKGWSQERLATCSGVSQSVICKIENKKTKNPSVEAAFRISDALGVDVRELFYYDDE